MKPNTVSTCLLTLFVAIGTCLCPNTEYVVEYTHTWQGDADNVVEVTHRFKDKPLQTLVTVDNEHGNNGWSIRVNNRLPFPVSIRVWVDDQLLPNLLVSHGHKQNALSPSISAPVRVAVVQQKPRKVDVQYFLAAPEAVKTNRLERIPSFNDPRIRLRPETDEDFVFKAPLILREVRDDEHYPY
ncbi:hypothetical protein PGT21_029001 [Puccinia graminis f. sp. tritici]|uniref:Uncharacterized protein n=2 Tax=Puccinia graminis f. sp. tritici TaxID=56615 RepID=E3K6M4_PUCGT|nr:uncharacterized protein PGTG_05255 [Puccinia graminis f. sp. tritici CRL 75-36-700-3]EFP80030.1 hypothetical protein PGTG_05255 [Puccinia graminis f. sp. tritici CRL 75-36-700-3]KAA1075818.1 hypothetical protein PGTUg99_017421 [Puccinia graminis f. sp. tritici]KAA1091169.1 hypothetical protein PGT21_027578 [Puccinia graminis f. sp. tritici]KAA1110663.1 hypothetical protein PGT21_029001 [Puccinia graminis f. sp. tritici]